MRTGAVVNRRNVVILVDDLQRHEALTRIRHRDGDRPGVEIKNAQRIKRVAVQTDDGLIVDRSRLTIMGELAKASLLRIVGQDGCYNSARAKF